jgi:hypothetical protein
LFLSSSVRYHPIGFRAIDAGSGFLKSSAA